MPSSTATLCVLASLLGALAVSVQAEPAPLRVVRVTPAGEDVAAERQIVFQFDRPVVALGHMARPRDAIPVRIRPRIACAWRWLDTSALACELDAEHRLAPATRYEVRMEPGIRGLDGATLDAPVHHTFVTRRPAVRWVGLETWLAPSTPLLRAVFDQPVSRASVARHLFVEPRGEGSARVPVRVAASHAAGRAALAGTASEAEHAHAALLASRAQTSWLLAPVEALPLDAEMALRVEPGLRGDGPEPGVGQRVVLAFDTFPEPRFTGMRCTHVATRATLDLAAEAVREGPGECDPLTGVALLFSVPVAAEDVQHAVSLAPESDGDAAVSGTWNGAGRRRGHHRPHRRGQQYPVWWRRPLAAFSGYRVRSADSPPLTDVFGRALERAVDTRFGTAHRRPSLRLRHRAAVLEHGVDSELPAWVTNLDALEITWRRTGSAQTHRRRLALPFVEDLAFAHPLGVRELLDGRTGAVSARVVPEPRAGIGTRRFFAQVTPFAVTVKLGHFGSIVWVTSLASGEPVTGAAITLHEDRYTTLAGPGPGAIGPFVTDARGIARLPGTAVLDPDGALGSARKRSAPRLFVRVEKGGELGLLPLDDDFRVWSREVWPERRRAFGHLKAWGTTAQGIYRAGDTIEFKLYVRHQDTHTLTPAPRDGYRLSVLDPKGEALLEGRQVELNAFGAFHGEVTVPEHAAVGWYRFRLHSTHGDRQLDAFRVLVSDFTPAPFKVRTDLNANAFEPGVELEALTTAALHAGGPYSGAGARTTVRVRSERLRPAHPHARGFRFGTGGVGDWRIVHQAEAALDGDGRTALRLAVPASGVLYGRLQVESAVRDDRGMRVAASATARLAERDRFVGLKDTRWLHVQGEPARVDYLVVDAAGDLVAGVPVSIAVEREEIFAARVKSSGSSYVTRYERRWERAGECAGRSEESGKPCVFSPSQPGRYRVTARIADTRGRVQRTVLHTWVRGSGRVVWAQADDATLAVTPERTDYEVGDTARFLVRNPFPGATALVSVERYGVLRSWTERFEGSTPVLEFPIRPDDLPGFHLSVTVVSPRVSAPPPERGQVDLGKPAMRMGYVRVSVDDPFKRLQIAVEPERAEYKPRDTARVRFAVTSPHTGGAPDAPVELAVAVLDEAVLDLVASGSRNFDPYRGFYAGHGLDVVSYSLLTRLVGRQKFETKGAASGGDGGRLPGLRDVFRFVSYWNPSLAVDADGTAEVEFALPDNLTGWRVLALAVTPGDRMGLGEGRLRVNRDTELRPVMPNEVVAGDRFRAGFTVLNRTGEPRTLAVRLAAGGDALARPVRHERTVRLAPFARETVWVDLRTAAAGHVALSARAGDADDTDGLEHRVPVRERATLLTAATHGSLDGASAAEPIAVPPAIVPGAGTIALVASPSIVGNADGAFRYMRDYPYQCWEQRLSKAVMAAHYARLRAYLDPDLRWPESDALPDRALAEAARFQAPGGGMSFWVPDDARASPYLSAYTALAFTWLRAAGHAPPARVSARLDAYLARLLRKNTLPRFYTRGMASSVRAVALAALARSGAATGADVLRYREHVPQMSVFAKAHYLDAAQRTLPGHPIVAEAADALLAHAQQSGGKLALNEAVELGAGQLLDTPARAGCAALSALLAVAEDPRLAASVQPLLSKLVRGISAARGRRTHWENTQENVFCMAALAEYAARFEAAPPLLRVRARVDRQPLGETRFRSLRDAPVTLARGLAADDAGKTRTLHIEREGRGRVYYSARLSYALSEPGAERVNAGMTLRREHSVRRDGRWTLLRSPMQVERGELLRVDLYLSLPTARHFVVVDDPVPGGLQPVNRDLATASAVDADAGRFRAAGGAWWHRRDDWRGFGSSHWSFYHKELRHRAARFYADYLPAGDYHLSYTAQAIASGEFLAEPARAEEMYDPDLFALGLPATLLVAEPAAP